MDWPPTCRLWHMRVLPTSWYVCQCSTWCLHLWTFLYISISNLEGPRWLEWGECYGVKLHEWEECMWSIMLDMSDLCNSFCAALSSWHRSCHSWKTSPYYNLSSVWTYIGRWESDSHVALVLACHGQLGSMAMTCGRIVRSTVPVLPIECPFVFWL